MSSYLTFYIVPTRKSNKEEKQYIPLASYSRSSELYEYFNNVIHPVFVGNSDETPYTVLTINSVDEVMKDFNSDINKAQKRLSEYEKYARNNAECIEDIISMKEYIEDLQYWKDKASFISDILQDKSLWNNSIEEVCCNIG